MSENSLYIYAGYHVYLINMNIRFNKSLEYIAADKKGI